MWTYGYGQRYFFRLPGATKDRPTQGLHALLDLVADRFIRRFGPATTQQVEALHWRLSKRHSNNPTTTKNALEKHSELIYPIQLRRSIFAIQAAVHEETANAANSNCQFIPVAGWPAAKEAHQHRLTNRARRQLWQIDSDIRDCKKTINQIRKALHEST